MKLIIGLGNPGKKYQNTRHNLGFTALDTLAKILSAKFTNSKKFLSGVAKIQTAEGEILLAKPQTYMNDSGKAAAALVNFYKISLADTLVIHDEIDLPFGKIRRGSGGAAGHQGVESILATIGSGFARLRIGIENRKEYRVPSTETYVLQSFTGEEKKMLTELILPRAIEEIKKFLK